MGLIIIIGIIVLISLAHILADGLNLWLTAPEDSKRNKFANKYILGYSYVSAPVFLIFLAIFIGFLLAIGINNCKTTVTSYNTDLAVCREYIVSQLESGVYRTVDDNDLYFSFGRDSSYGLKETMKEAMEFDKEITTHRICCDSFWIGVFNTPIDDSIQPINATQYIDGTVKYGVDGDFKFAENDTWKPSLL